MPVLPSCRSTLANRRPEGSEAAGEDLPGSAAQPAQERRFRRETGEGTNSSRRDSSSDALAETRLHQPTFVYFLSPQMVSKLPVMKSICNLHIDKLEFFRLVHPETAYSFPPLYREVFGSEMCLPDSTNS